METHIMTKSAYLNVFFGVAFVLAAGATANANDETGGAKGPNREITTDVGTTVIKRMSAIYSTDNFTCDSKPRVLLSKTIKQRRLGNIGVHFQSENFPGCRILLSLRVDGATVAGPGDAASPFASHDTKSNLSTNGFIWAVRRVKEGNHRVQVVCECLNDGETNLVDERELLIYHR